MRGCSAAAASCPATTISDSRREDLVELAIDLATLKGSKGLLGMDPVWSARFARSRALLPPGDPLPHRFKLYLTDGVLQMYEPTATHRFFSGDLSQSLICRTTATPAQSGQNKGLGARQHSGETSAAWLERIGMARNSSEQLLIAVAELFMAVSNILQDECESAEECVQRAQAILQIDRSPGQYVGTDPTKRSGRTGYIGGGLAPGQARRAKTHIETNLSSKIKSKELAKLVGLSASHFSRAFRETFGEPPHGYVMRRRLERAQGLILTTNIPLLQIAAECGLADQAHLNRLFDRFVGESPGAWRRARAMAST
jgi:AraC family transcriptional regulator